MSEQSVEKVGLRVTLRDIDNRDGDGAPYEVTGTPDEVCGYIDGPLRSDLTDNHDDDLAKAMAAVRSGDMDAANVILRPMAVHLHNASEDR